MSFKRVEISGVNTSNLEVLSNDEMIYLFKKMNEGDTFARNRLASGNLKLVLSIIRKYNNHENLDDLFQVGCIGLMKAIDNFDINHGVRFSTYAVPMIMGEVKRYIRDNSTMRISRSLKDLRVKIIRFREEEMLRCGKVPSIEKVAEYLDSSIYEVTLALQSLKEPISIHSPIYDDGGDTIYLYDQISDEKNSLKKLDLLLSLKDAVKNLESREKYILDERFITGKTQTEIAEELMISQAQVSRLEQNAIKTLKKTLKH